MILAIGIYVGYLLFLLVLILVWNTWKSSVIEELEISISVIVPFRNEEKALPRLIAGLKAQSHASFEVVFVNDHSEDGGEAVLEELLKNASFPFQIHSLDGAVGKKAAIDQGIQLATHHLILTTDADCFAGPNWLKDMSKPFHEPSLQMLVGPVVLIADSFWQKMQSIEFSSLIGIGGAFLRMKTPIMANGANLAYRKSAFEQVGGFKGIDETPSGDDELLMNKVNKAFPKGIQFQKSNAALVKSSAVAGWASFKQQRLRWASKWKVGFRALTMLTAIIVFTVQLIQILLIVLLVTQSGNLELNASLLGSKLLIEFIFLWSVRRSFGQKMHGLAFLVNYLLYPFYAIYFGLAANFAVFDWKGRGYKVNSKS